MNSPAGSLERLQTQRATASARVSIEIQRPSVSICLPAYNEAGTIRGVVEDAHAFLLRAGLPFEIIICDDASTDGTKAIVDEVAAALDRVRVLHHPENRGIRATFEDLYGAACCDLIFLNSTDGQWPIQILQDMLPMTDDYDVIVAARRNKHYGFPRRLISGGFNLVPRVLFGVRTTDAGAVKLIKREVVRATPVISRSPFNEAERLIRATRAGYRIGFFPVEISQRRSGQSHAIKLTVLAEAMKDVLRVWWTLRRETGSRRFPRW